jgi:hypothetical protein
VGIKFNVPKYKVMHLGRNDPKTSTYKMNRKTLKTTSEEKDIGVSVTEKLKASAQ